MGVEDVHWEAAAWLSCRGATLGLETAARLSCGRRDLGCVPALGPRGAGDARSRGHAARGP